MFQINAWIYVLIMIVVDVAAFAFVKIQQTMAKEDESLAWTKDALKLVFIVNPIIFVSYFFSRPSIISMVGFIVAFVAYFGILLMSQKKV